MLTTPALNSAPISFSLPPVESKGPKLVRYSQVVKQTMSWLWPQRVAVGRVTVLVGETGMEKAAVAVDLAARVSRGDPWPNQTDGSAPLGTTIVVGPADEDYTLMPDRLAAAGADADRVVALEIDASGDGLQTPSAMESKLTALQTALEATPDCKLVVIDPLSMFLIDANGDRNGAMPKLLYGLTKLARRFGVAVVAVAHLGGQASQRTFERSLAMLGAATAGRSVWGVFRDPEDSQQRLMLPLNGNFAEEQEGLTFRLVSREEMEVPHVEWGAAAVTSARKVWAANSAFRASEQSYRDSEGYVTARLREVLSDRPQNRSLINLLIHASEAQLYRAAKRLGVITSKPGFYDGWAWMLPEHFPAWQAEREQREQAQKLERRHRKNEKRRRTREKEREVRAEQLGRRADGRRSGDQSERRDAPNGQVDDYRTQTADCKPLDGVVAEPESAWKQRMFERLHQPQTEVDPGFQQAGTFSRLDGREEERVDLFIGGASNGARK
jgi:putative DNA primase/helicase